MANEFKVKKGLIVEGSGGTVLDIQGSQGQLFSITDSLTGDIFSVSDISGIPIFNINSDGTGTHDGNFNVTGNVTGVNLSGTNTGDQVLTGLDYAATAHTHDDRYYTETESNAKYLLNTTDTLTGNLTVSAKILAAGQITVSAAALQVNGFQRTGNIYLHSGGNSPGTVDTEVILSNVTGNFVVNKNISASNLSGTNTGDQDLSGYLTSLPSHNHDTLYLKKGSLGTIGNANVSFGSTAAWPNNPVPGFYKTSYSGYSGLVFMSGDVGGSTSSMGIEFAYNGNLKIHSNTDSSSWTSHDIWTSNNHTSGTAAANWTAGNDPRLSDARTPVAHNHDYLPKYSFTGQMQTYDGTIASFFKEGSSPTYTIIETQIEGNLHMMGGFSIDLFNNYSTYKKTSINIDGYWNAVYNSGHVGWFADYSNPHFTPNMQVGNKTSTNKTVIIIENDSSSFLSIVARDLHLSRQSSQVGHREGWTIVQAADLSAYQDLVTVGKNTINKSTVESVLTGSISSHTHAYLGSTAKAADSELLDGVNSTGYLSHRGIVSGDWDTIFNTETTGTAGIYQVQNIASGHSNHPTGVYTYGSVMAWRAANATFKMYASHTGDLVYQTGWNSDEYSGWRNVLTNANFNTWAPSKAGTGATGTWGISISGNSSTASNLSNGGGIASGSGSRYMAIDSTNGWAYLNLKKSGVTQWDLAAFNGGDFEIRPNGSGTNAFSFSKSGNLTAGNFILSSDKRLKKDLSILKSNKLKPKRWTWKDSEKKDFGFIAQDLEVDFPEVVITGEDGFKKVAYNKITAINAARINELEDKITILEALINKYIINK